MAREFPTSVSHATPALRFSKRVHAAQSCFKAGPPMNPDPRFKTARVPKCLVVKWLMRPSKLTLALDSSVELRRRRLWRLCEEDMARLTHAQKWLTSSRVCICACFAVNDLKEGRQSVGAGIFNCWLENCHRDAGQAIQCVNVPNNIAVAL